jgi:ABC-type Na+ efflux pump permease subunit
MGIRESARPLPPAETLVNAGATVWQLLAFIERRILDTIRTLRTMRAILFILILAVVALLVAVATGFLDISQTRQAEVPSVSVDESGVATSGGRTPAFDVETGSVSVGTQPANVKVPTVRVNPPEQQNTVENSTAR